MATLRNKNCSTEAGRCLRVFLCFPHNFLMTCKSPVWLGQSVSIHFLCLFVCDFWCFFTPVIGPFSSQKHGFTLSSRILGHDVVWCRIQLLSMVLPSTQTTTGVWLLWDFIVFFLLPVPSVGLYYLQNTLFQKAWCLTVCSLKNVNFLFGQQELFLLLPAWCQCIYVQTHSNCICSHSDANRVTCRCRCKTLGFLNASRCFRGCVAGSKWDCVNFMDRRCRHRQALGVFCFGALRSLLVLFTDAGVLLASSGSDLHLALDQLTVEREVAGMRISTSKADTMVLTLKREFPLQVGEESPSQMEEFNYFRVLFMSGARVGWEIDRKIAAVLVGMQRFSWSAVVKKVKLCSYPQLWPRAQGSDWKN